MWMTLKTKFELRSALEVQRRTMEPHAHLAVALGPLEQLRVGLQVAVGAGAVAGAQARQREVDERDAHAVAFRRNAHAPSHRAQFAHHTGRLGITGLETESSTCKVISPRSNEA